MRLTSKGRYAVTALLDVAIHSHGNPVSLAKISERQGISIYYLEQLFALLCKKNIVFSIRGPGGGYLLGQEVNKITLSSIMNAVNESIDATKCRGTKSCSNGYLCLTHYLWTDITNRINDFIKNITLAELVNNVHKKIHNNSPQSQLTSVNE